MLFHLEMWPNVPLNDNNLSDCLHVLQHYPFDNGVRAAFTLPAENAVVTLVKNRFF